MLGICWPCYLHTPHPRPALPHNNGGVHGAGVVAAAETRHLLSAPVVVRDLAGQVLVREGAGAGRRQEPLPARLGAARVEAEPVAQVQPQQRLTAEGATATSESRLGSGLKPSLRFATRVLHQQ